MNMDIEAAKQDLLEIKEILDRLKIKFWLSDGTLLGAVREKNFISYDHDIDTRMLAKDWNPSICEEFRRENFECGQIILRKLYQDKVSQGFFAKRNIRTDVGLEYYYPPEDIYVVLAICPSRESAIRPARFCRGDCFIDFLGTSFRVPNPPEECLEWIYGKDWRVPITNGSWFRRRKRISMNKYLKYFREHPKEEWLR